MFAYVQTHEPRVYVSERRRIVGVVKSCKLSRPLKKVKKSIRKWVGADRNDTGSINMKHSDWFKLWKSLCSLHVSARLVRIENDLRYLLPVRKLNPKNLADFCFRVPTLSGFCKCMWILFFLLSLLWLLLLWQKKTERTQTHVCVSRDVC